MLWLLALALGCKGQPSRGDDRPEPKPTAVRMAEIDAASTAPAPDAMVRDKSLPSFETSMSSIEMFRQFADRPGGVIRTGEVVKFLIDNRGSPGTQPPVYFINANFTDGGDETVGWVALHREWAEQALANFDYTLKKFSRTAYFTTEIAKRDFISGRIQTFETNGEVFFGVWFIEMDLIAEEMLQFALEQLKRTFRVSDYPLHFVAYSTHQTTKRIAPWLSENGIVVHRLSDLLADVPFQSLNTGEAWGYLRIAPIDPDALEANEIPVFETMPLDLGVVAGTITTAFQDVASHVNIKAKQRNTPNLMVRDEDAIARIKSMDGTPVHLTVTQDNYALEPTTAVIVESKLAALLAGRTWKMPPANFDLGEVSFDEMCRGKNPASCLARASQFGGKAAGLGFLANERVIGEGSPMQKKLGYRLSPLGFAVPIASYREFLEYNAEGKGSLKAAIDRLVAAERGDAGYKALSSIATRELIHSIQQAFLVAPFPPGMYERFHRELLALETSYAKHYPGQQLKRFKVRSSANVEDIPSFNGAGLHNSYSAKRKLSVIAQANEPCRLVVKQEKTGVKSSVEPKSLACAVRGAYASLWNLRAVRERSFRRFDHRGAYMGLAVVPSYKHGKKSPQGKIASNGVLLTRVLNAPKTYGYQLSTQVGDNLATNPNPGTLAELTTLTFQLKSVPAPTVMQYALPLAGEPRRTEPILSDLTMRGIVAIARAIEEAYCKAKPTYFLVAGKQRKCHQVSNSQEKPTALDMEIKTYESGEILFKQVREFDGR